VLQLDTEAADILKELQQKLNGVLDELSVVFAKSMEPQIQASIKELGQLLCKVKGSGQVSLSQPSQRSGIQHESDMVLRPLMDLLEGRWATHARTHTHACTHTDAHAHTHACMHAYTHRHAHTHAHTHAHMHILYWTTVLLYGTLISNKTLTSWSVYRERQRDLSLEISKPGRKDALPGCYKMPN
jgi:hypothetical protein